MPDLRLDLDDQFDADLRRAVAKFGAVVGPLLRARIGQAEANLTAPVETLLSDVAFALGLDFRSHREAADRTLGVRADLAVEIAKAPIGVVELKAPGMGVPGSPRWGKIRDRAQFDKLKALPNVLYTDGSNWAVFHYGVRNDVAVLEGDLERAGSRLRPRDSVFESVLKEFLYWQPVPPRSLRNLIEISAGLCRLLRDEVTDALRRERLRETKPFLTEHLADWQTWLFPNLTDQEFADSYAQTITFGLLLARRESVIFEGLEVPDIGERLAKRHLLVGRALSILTARPDRGKSIEERSIVLQTMRRVVGAADWSRWSSAGTYHWLYERFLEAYDPKIRRLTGAYYTPSAVANFMTRFVDDVLRQRLHIERGLADDFVVILDPAMGTGTFLQSVVDQVAGIVDGEKGDVPASLRALLTRLIGFERQIGPFAVAELKLDQALDAHKVEAKDEDFRLYVADTLDNPSKALLPLRASVYSPLANSRLAANRVKTDESVTVVLGNPPYRSKAKALGKWVLEHGRRDSSLLDDFRISGNAKHEYKLHDLAIYFWRWGLWKAFESTPSQPAGVVAFITTRAYLDGPAFAGMRRYLRRYADYGWIVDLSPEGHWSATRSRIFPGVPHPVCIGIFARSSTPRPRLAARIAYLSVTGSQEDKFDALGSIGLDNPKWRKCASEWTAPLRPKQTGAWTQYPNLDDLLPYTSLGVTCNRAWVHAPDAETLHMRWTALVSAIDLAEKRQLLKESPARKVDKAAPPMPGKRPRRALLYEDSLSPHLVRYGFRSFDRQYLIADERVIDRFRADLWRIHGENQVYLISHLGAPIRSGLAIVFTCLIPDTDHFKSHNGGRVIPLYRDAQGREANADPRLLELLQRRLGRDVAGEDLMAYIAGSAAHRGYTSLFGSELQQPGVRIPITADPILWNEAVKFGRNVIWLHTFGERFADPASGRPRRPPTEHRPGVVGTISSRPQDVPERLKYLDEEISLDLGSARLTPVSREVLEYEVSGMKVLRHWFDYRKRKPAGRKGGSKLDHVRAGGWTLSMTEELRNLVAVLGGCIKIEPQQTHLLERIVSGKLIGVADLAEASVIPVDHGRWGVSDSDDDAQERLF